MEIKFDNKSIELYRELSCQTKHIQESVESVVPDTDEDIGRIASVQSTVLLKSKDITARGVLISGEAKAAVLYITEDQSEVSFVRLSKAFSIEYDVESIAPDAAAQIALSVASAEARIINPRKLSVSFDISGELHCYIRETMETESILPESVCDGLHLKYENTELSTADAVCEKTFSVNEQFVFPNGKPSPSKLVSAAAELNITDSQLVGSRVIVKGSTDVTVCYLSEDVNYPVCTEFSVPFSQIVDIGTEVMDFCTERTELTGTYFDILDSVNGEKMLDAELHAVIQLVCRSSKKLSYAADAYSNLMPVSCCREKYCFNTVSDTAKLKFSSDERINVADECVDVLSVFVSISRLAQEQTKLEACASVDIVYRSSGGQLSSVRRYITVNGECTYENMHIVNARLTDVYLRPDGQFVDAHIAVEIKYTVCGSLEFTKLCSLELNEEEPYAFDKFPTLTLVRVDGETMWELAKTYHSSVECIDEQNRTDGELNGRLLLIPKTL